jgi:hypothetical protein
MKSAVLDFRLADYEPIVTRDLDLGDPLPPRRGNLVTVVTGMRRSGKSYRLFQEMKRLLDSGVEPERILYFNFEDNRFRPVTPQTGDELLATWRSLYPEAVNQGLYLFFDEIQEMRDWGPWMRRIVDTTKSTIYVTGSSSQLLSSEISTGFRGRAIDYELLPYSYPEFLRAKGLSHPDPASLHAYLDAGGFPATIGLPSAQRNLLLQSYAQRVVARDVVERHGLSNLRAATYFAQRALNSNGREFSIRNATNALSSIGVKTQRSKLSDVLGYLQDAYLVFTLPQLKFSGAEKTNARPKLYAIDPGLVAANATAAVNDLGQRLENAVYLELRRRSLGLRRESICSFRTAKHGWEVDFTFGDALSEGPRSFTQVCVSVDDADTLERETRALFEAMEETGTHESELVVLDGANQTIERDGMRIRISPAHEWLTGPAVLPG